VSATRDPKDALRSMLEARSVAVVGASAKPGSLGAQMMAELRRGGFDGAVYPVNPSYDEIDGNPCYPSILEVPEPIDLAILGVANARIEQTVRQTAEAGAASIVTFSSLYEAEPPEPGLPPLRERVRAVALEHGMAFCGGNGMGFLNLESRVRATGFLTPDNLRPGPVAFISHSGSAFAAFSFNDRGLGFNIIVSSGQEVVSTMADFMAYAIDRPSTRVIALLLETARDPDNFRAQLARAAELDVAVLALKVGRTEVSRAMVTAHSGALAGEHGAYEALFDAYGVHEVRTMDELADAIELFTSPRRVRGGSGIATVHDSGGERALLVDLASDLGVPFASVSEETLGRVQKTLDEGLVAANPLDAWGTGIDADAIFRQCFVAFADDPEVAAMAFVVDLTRQGEPYGEGYLQVARDAFDATEKPFCMVSNLSSAIAREEAAMLRQDGIPVLEGTESGLRALGHLLGEAERRVQQAGTPPPHVDEDVRERWRHRLASPEPLAELEGLALLGDYGVPVARVRVVEALRDARAAADDIGYPVALKTAKPGVLHKTEADGVRLGIEDRGALDAAYGELAGRLGPRVLVAEMAPRGIEAALGVLNDATFGPLVLVGAGGVLVEWLHDRRLGLPPLDRHAARRLIDGLRIRPLFDGVRGAEPADVGALANAVSRLSVLAADLGDLLEALDANPVIVSSSGCLAVDALVVARASARPHA
jgi:acyl-CoA synthetase (NDP forming)